MSTSFSLNWLKSARWISPEHTARFNVLLLLMAGAFVISLVYHVYIWVQDGMPALAWQGIYHLTLLVGFAVFWRAFSHLFQHRSLSPIGIFWTILIAGVLFAGIGWLTWTVGPPRFEELAADTIMFTQVLHMHVIVLLETSFFFFLLVRLRQLVLFKRTRQSKRNWHLLMGLMALAALSAIGLRPGDSLGVLQAVFIVPAVIYMVINSFRLSWIIFLSFREKMICMALAIGVILMLAVPSNAGTAGFVPGAVAYVQYYSYPLHVFLMLSAVFGIIYMVTAWTSLLFHLPTTSDIQRKADEMAAMHGLTHLVEQVFDREKLAQSIVSAPIEAGSAQCAWLVLPDGSGADLAPVVVAARGIGRNRIERELRLKELYQQVDQQHAPLLLDEAPADPRVHTQPGTGIDSLLAVPLMAREKLVGVLFSATDVTHGFEEDDIEAISGFAAQAALALDHARLFEEQLEKERLERELAIAREVQQRLLPDELPSVPGISLHASSVPAQEVGGDYYDFLPLHDGRMAFIVADVSGKGTSAAFYMAELQGIFRSSAALAPDPSDFLTHANDTLSSIMEPSTFISAIYGVIDPNEESLTLARAGHCPAAAITLHGEAHYIRPNGIGLGMNQGSLFAQALSDERITLNPGDAFVLYTDGVVESRNTDGEQFGYDRLLDALRKHRHEDADAMHHAILDELCAFTGAELYDDDMTMVVIKWHALSSSETNPAQVQMADGALPHTAPAREEPPATA